ncbi:hypothetical protein CHUAL_004936 [Chamberlinius hualienensis]
MVAARDASSSVNDVNVRGCVENDGAVAAPACVKGVGGAWIDPDGNYCPLWLGKVAEIDKSTGSWVVVVAIPPGGTYYHNLIGRDEAYRYYGNSSSSEMMGVM